ncbi:hypothetical protein ACA910_000298 [Epithemia clementina (nom. ined.)]
MFICPALLTCRWRKQLGRISDVIFTGPVGSDIWNKDQHEPLLVAFILPFFTSRPWQFKRDKPAVDAFTTSLQKCGHPIKPMSGNICANYGYTRSTSRVCTGAWHDQCYAQLDGDQFPIVQASDLDDALMDREDLGEIIDNPQQFKESRAGNFLMCNDCSFFNIKGRYPGNDTLEKDKLLQICNRQATLDSFGQGNEAQLRGTEQKFKVWSSLLNSLEYMNRYHPGVRTRPTILLEWGRPVQCCSRRF